MNPFLSVVLCYLFVRNSHVDPFRVWTTMALHSFLLLLLYDSSLFSRYLFCFHLALPCSPPTSNGTRIFVPSQKMLEEWSIRCINSKRTKHLLPGSGFIRIKSNKEWSIVAVFGLALPNPYWSTSVESESTILGDELLCTLQPLSYRWNVASLSIAITVGDVRTSYIP